LIKLTQQFVRTVIKLSLGCLMASSLITLKNLKMSQARPGMA
jgi:hypothetical protein